MAKSKQEADLDTAIKAVFGPAKVTPEFTIKVKGKTLFVDRVLRSYLLAFEIDGRQHDEFVEHFHGDAQGFAESKLRDRLKAQWLESNGYTLVRFSHNERITPELLRKKLSAALP